MKLLLVGRSQHRNKVLRARLWQQGIPGEDIQIVTPGKFEGVISASPDAHFICVFVNDSKWSLEDEYSRFYDMMSSDEKTFDNCQYLCEYYAGDGSDIYAVYHTWQNITKMVEVLLRNDRLTIKNGKIVLFPKNPDEKAGAELYRLYSIDNFVAIIMGDDEGMAECTKAYLQLSEVVL